ncbi:MAG: CBS domain-containing protein, partial [Thermoanaerobaculia bacterium]
RLVGVISDGDLRRVLQKDEEILKRKAVDAMKKNPVTIDSGELASAALQIMEQKKITSIFSIDGENKLEGLIHLHDLWGLELF